MQQDPRTPMHGTQGQVYPPQPQQLAQLERGYVDAQSMQSSVFTYPNYAAQAQYQINDAIREELGDSKISDYFVLSLLVLICNPLCALPAIIFAIKSRNANKDNNLEEALTNGKLALALSVAALFSGFIIWSFIVLYSAVFAFALYNPYEDIDN